MGVASRDRAAPRQPWAAPWNPLSAAAPQVVSGQHNTPSSSSQAGPSSQSAASLHLSSPARRHEAAVASGENNSETEHYKSIVKDMMLDLLNPLNPPSTSSSNMLGLMPSPSLASSTTPVRGNSRSDRSLVPSASVPDLSASPHGVPLKPVDFNPSRYPIEYPSNNAPGSAARRDGPGLVTTAQSPLTRPIPPGLPPSAAAALRGSSSSAVVSRSHEPEEPSLSQELMVQDMLRGLARAHGRTPSRGSQLPATPLRPRR